MVEAKCPVCASHKFFLRDAEDEFEVHDFEIIAGEIVVSPAEAGSQAPPVEDGTETHCSRCSWHGPLGRLKKGG
jgi:ssRNA-specific RNase YbeY (16S rRNA maturation enzyme)